VCTLPSTTRIVILTTADGITVLTIWQKTHRLSHDNRWHVYVSSDELNQPVVLCIFEPANSSEGNGVSPRPRDAHRRHP
jgi:hypothetical protein